MAERACWKFCEYKSWFIHQKSYVVRTEQNSHHVSQSEMQQDRDYLWPCKMDVAYMYSNNGSEAARVQPTKSKII